MNTNDKINALLALISVNCKMRTTGSIKDVDLKDTRVARHSMRIRPKVDGSDLADWYEAACKYLDGWLSLARMTDRIDNPDSQQVYEEWVFGLIPEDDTNASIDRTGRVPIIVRAQRVVK